MADFGSYVGLIDEFGNPQPNLATLTLILQEAETVRHQDGKQPYSRHEAAQAGQPAIEARLASFAWERQGIPSALHSISLKATKGQLVMVVGVVGSGKSSLIAALLGELHSQGGSLQVSFKSILHTLEGREGGHTNKRAGRGVPGVVCRGEGGGAGPREQVRRQAVMALVVVCALC